MRILILSDSDSPHTIKWAKSIQKNGNTIGIFSISKINFSLYEDCPKIWLFSAGVPKETQFKREASLSKLIYLKSLKHLKNTIKIFKPDILHAHYVSSYGFIGSLAKFHPFIISVWGADIYNFPQKSLLHFWIIKYTLSKADQILSTSFAMKQETKKYTKKSIYVTPFGIPLDKFYPQKVNSLFSADNIVIGTIKTLEKKYGIEYLIKAFRIVKDKKPEFPIKLLIVGRGSLTERLKSLVLELGLNADTIFTGYIENSEIEKYHNMLDIAVYPSIEDSESFGVSVLESSACGKPVIVSNVGGLPEVVEDGITGYLVKKEDPELIADCLIKLIYDKELRVLLGMNGIKKVSDEYAWEKSLEKMISVYKTTLKNKYKSL